MSIYTPAQTVTAFEVDDSNIVFSPPGVQACSTTGCALGPTTVTEYEPAARRFLANGFALVSIPNAGATGRYTGYRLCPVGGCTTTNYISYGEENQQVAYHTRTASTHNFYRSMTAPPGSSLSACISPVNTACSSVSAASGIKTSTIIAGDEAVYFKGSADSLWYGCEVSTLATCTPNAINLPTSSLSGIVTVLGAYGKDLYFYLPGGAPPNTVASLRRCPWTGCGTTNGTSLGQITTGAIAAAEIDASGVYWISGSTIKMCPLSGCVGAPYDVTTSAANATMLRLNSDFVFWVNSSSSAIMRVAKPAY